MRSHIDTIMFCRYLYLDSNDYISFSETQIQTANQQELFEIFLAIQSENQKISTLSFHENYHYWQGLRLPYLVWSSFTGIYNVLGAFSHASQKDTDYTNWEMDIPILNIYSQKHYISGEIDNLEIDHSNNTGISLSIIDLLEAATSIAEYQVSVSHAERTNPITFSRWCKKNPAYINVFRFVSKLLCDEELTLRLLIPFVNGAFSTNQPVRAFIYLIKDFKLWQMNDPISIKFLAQKEPCKWDVLVEELLEKLPYTDKENSSMDPTNEKFFKLTIENWVDSYFSFSGNQKLYHPFVHEQASKWLELSYVDAGFKSVLNYPGYLNSQIVEYVSKHFNPVVTFVKFTLNSGSSKVVAFGQLGNEIKYDWPIPMLDLYTIYSTIKKAAKVQFFEKHRMCGHNDCSFFEDNYCNSYPSIPNNMNDCGFPNRINNLINLFHERT